MIYVFAGLTAVLLGFAIWLFWKRGQLAEELMVAKAEIARLDGLLALEKGSSALERAAKMSALERVTILQDQLRSRNESYVSLTKLVESGSLCSAADIAAELRRLLP